MTTIDLLIWFDNKETHKYFFHNFFGSDYKFLHDKTSFNKMNKYYNIAPELVDFYRLKKRTELLSSLYGKQYSQSLLYWHLTLNRFLRLSLPINRLAYLLNDTFLYFESFLHFKSKWANAKLGFYRDHTLHTTGEAYLGVEFLKNNNKIIDTLTSFIEKISHDTGRYFREFSCINKDNLKHIVYKTWLISALFHDLGYVISFNKELNADMRKFHPHSSMLFKSNFPNFEEIQYTLGNSLLFKTVDHDVIKKSFDCNKHGCYSALLILLTFYSPPAFDGVSHDDRIAVELAAKSIFFHDFPSEPEEAISVTINNDTSEQDCNSIKLEEVGLSDSILDLIKKKMGSSGKLSCQKIRFIPNDKCKKSKRETHLKDPFSFFLRFIDELQVFGRSQLSFVKSNESESEHSFRTNRIRNLVRFPAQIVNFHGKNGDEIQIYYIVDNSLIEDVNLKDEDSFTWCKDIQNGGIKFFLIELFWLDKSINDVNSIENIHFPKVEFFLVYV